MDNTLSNTKTRQISINLGNSCLVYFLLVLSGNQFLSSFIPLEFLLVAATIFLVLFSYYRECSLLNKKAITIFVLFLFLFAIQSFKFQSISFATNLGFFIRLFIGYAVVKLVYDFPHYYIKVMYCLSLLSLAFWIIGLVGVMDNVVDFFPSQIINERTDEKKYLLFFHTYIVNENGVFLRNAGMFWEPGAFAGYIIIALVFLGLKRNSYSRKSYSFLLITLVFTLLTTFSTSGYLLLPLSILLHFNYKFKTIEEWISKVILFFLLFITIVLLSYFLVNNISFLGEKVKHQWDRSHQIDAISLSRNQTRFGSALFDWYYIKKNPIVGNGLHEKTRYKDHLDDLVPGYSNGFTDFIAKFGISGILLYTWFLFKSFSFITTHKFKALLAILLLILLLNTELFLNYPLFLSFMFLSLSGVKVKYKYQSRLSQK